MEKTAPLASPWLLLAVAFAGMVMDDVMHVYFGPPPPPLSGVLLYFDRDRNGDRDAQGTATITLTVNSDSGQT